MKKVDAFWGSVYFDQGANQFVFFERNSFQNKERETWLTDVKEPLLCARPDEFQKIRKHFKNEK
jgi:hypothetical protein